MRVHHLVTPHLCHSGQYQRRWGVLRGLPEPQTSRPIGRGLSRLGLGKGLAPTVRQSTPAIVYKKNLDYSPGVLHLVARPRGYWIWKTRRLRRGSRTDNPVRHQCRGQWHLEAHGYARRIVRPKILDLSEGRIPQYTTGMQRQVGLTVWLLPV